jgi:hypothetical protein
MFRAHTATTEPKPLANRGRFSKAAFLALVLAGVVVLVESRDARAKPQDIPTSTPATAPDQPQIPTSDVGATRREAWTLTLQRLKATDRDLEARIDPALRCVSDFLQERKSGARPFVDYALGYRSKWIFVKKHWPWNHYSQDPVQAYLEQRWNECLFTPDDLHRVLASSVTRFLDDIRDAEDELLVSIRVDLADFPAAALPDLQSEAAFRAAYASTLDAMGREVGMSLVSDVGREIAVGVGSGIAARVLTMVATRLAVSSGLLATGVSLSPESLGATLVAAILLDWAISWWTDPTPQLVAEVEATLDRIGRLAIEGESNTPGLRDELLRIHRERSQLRRHVLAEVVLRQKSGPTSQP